MKFEEPFTIIKRYYQKSGNAVKSDRIETSSLKSLPVLVFNLQHYMDDTISEFNKEYEPKKYIHEDILATGIQVKDPNDQLEDNSISRIEFLIVDKNNLILPSLPKRIKLYNKHTKK